MIFVDLPASDPEATSAFYFDARYAAFRDPWGAEIVLWRDKGTHYNPAPAD
jgi:predicted enzyme related to lactoylglutathione lyase